MMDIFHFKKKIITIICFFSHATAFSQHGENISFFKKIGPDNGLSSYNVSKIIQDQFGFIWAATQDGLNRYDGNKFVVYNKSESVEHRLLGNVINDIVEDSGRNLIWVSTSYGGLNAIDIISGKIVETVPVFNEWLKCLAICKGNVWIGTYNGLRIYLPSRHQLVNIDSVINLENQRKGKRNINFVFVDRFEHVWVNVPSAGLYIYSGISMTLIAFYPAKEIRIKELNVHLQYAGRISLLNQNQILYGTDAGFRILTYDQNGLLRVPEAITNLSKYLRDSIIVTCAVDINRNFFFATATDLYRSNASGTFVEKIEDMCRGKDPDWLKSIHSILIDKNNNLWIGGEKGIAFGMTKKNPFTPFYDFPAEKFKIEHANYLCAESDSTVLVCSKDGFIRLNILTNRIHLFDKDKVLDFCFRTNDSNAFVSGESGTYVFYRREKLGFIGDDIRELTPLNHESINSAVESGDSVIVMASETSKGIYIWNRKNHTFKNLVAGLSEKNYSIINNLYKDSNGNIWILLDNYISILNINTRKFRTIYLEDPEAKIPLSLFFDMCQIGENYWITVYGKGIVEIDRCGKIKKMISLNDGLKNTGVYKIFPYQDSILFVTTNDGLYEISTKNGTVKRAFFKNDGLNSSNFEEGCGTRFHNLFLAGGKEGFSLIDPLKIEVDTVPPRTFITKISEERSTKSFDSTNLKIQEFLVSNQAIHIRIDFSAINFTHPGESIYAYCIPELDKNWINIGSQAYVYLTGMRPGRYHFLVRSANQDGFWSAAKEIRLIFIPPWYQTWWFVSVILLFIIFMVFFLFQYRLRQLQIQQNIRRNIATDLHDDIGASLNAAKMYAHLAKNSPSKTHHLSQIEDSLTEASFGLRDILWVLDDNMDSLFQIIERIKRFAAPAVLARGISLKCELHDDTNGKPVAKSEKKNLLLIAKEAITNCLKYSQCKNLVIKLHKSANELSLIIEDDGIGFDVALDNSTGYGLKNIVARANQIKCAVKIQSNPLCGTIIEISRKN
ncbi:MAG: hypothetical protein JST75_09195 [Bacteroidetes bacterium]|nr:hypothetical protein [Bacteroidota bacterium]